MSAIVRVVWVVVNFNDWLGLVDLMAISIVNAIVDVQVTQTADNVGIILDACWIANVIATHISIVVSIWASERNVHRYLILW